jgi:hypothetical protein
MIDRSAVTPAAPARQAKTEHCNHQTWEVQTR